MWYNHAVEQSHGLIDYLNERIRRHGLSNRAAADRIGIADTTLLRILRGDSIPDPETCRKIATWAKVSEEYVLRLAGHLGDIPARDSVIEATAEMERLVNEVSRLGAVIKERPGEYAIRGTVPAGYPRTEEEQIVGHVRIPPDALWIKVSGDSLTGLRIEHGDIIVVDPRRREPRRGQLAVVRLLDTNEVTVKRFFREDGFVRLEPANTEYKAILATNVEVLGVVIWVLWEP
jgi:SOS-response transcriptional repressor LexA